MSFSQTRLAKIQKASLMITWGKDFVRESRCYHYLLENHQAVYMCMKSIILLSPTLSLSPSNPSLRVYLMPVKKPTYEGYPGKAVYCGTVYSDRKKSE